MTDTEILLQIQEDLAALVAHVAALTRAELRLLEAVLPVVAATVQGRSFAAADLFDVPALAAVLGDHSASSLSWLFRRCAGRKVAGVRIDSAGRDRGGALWAVTTLAKVVTMDPPKQGSIGAKA